MDQSRYRARRAEFLDKLGDAVAVVPAGKEQVRNDDVTHEFRQSSDFFFLTGFPEPDAVAVFDPRSDTEAYTLFVRPRDEVMEAWNGLRVGVDGAVERYGADAAYPVEELEEWLRTRLVGADAIAYALGNAAYDSTIIKALNTGFAHSDRIGTASPSGIVDPRPILSEMRLIKSPPEIDALKEACGISAIAHTEAMRFAAPGRTERQVAAVIAFVAASMDSERLGYPSIVAGGDNACILHYVDNDKPLRDGELLLIDAGAEFRHFTADITRTFPINGTFTAAQRALYDLVLATHKAIIAMVKPGLVYADMHTTATRLLSDGLVDLGLLPGTGDEALAKGWYRQFFFHGTGHWLGSDVHDAGAYRRERASRALESGMAFTVEPGLYVARNKTRISLGQAPYDPDEVTELTLRLGISAAKAELDQRNSDAGTVDFEVPAEFLGIGVRIEDDILVIPDGAENMTAMVPVDPDAVEAVCAEPSTVPVFAPDAKGALE
ncbi:MAG: aminopeptidase P N-terminal domain-containing protein [Acidimicrobiia bacterium]